MKYRKSTLLTLSSLTTAAVCFVGCETTGKVSSESVEPAPAAPNSEGGNPQGGSSGGGSNNDDDAVRPEPPADASTNGMAPDGATGTPVDCAEALLPTGGLLAHLSAGAGVITDGAGVLSWQDQADPGRVATRQGGAPSLVPDVLAGRPVLRFDGVDDVLHWPGFELNGKTELSVALVNATDFKAPGQEWCCSDDETGCSGTYHVPLFWNGTADWSGVLIAPVQEEVALRFGNGVKHYSDGFYDTQAWKVCEGGQKSCAGGIPIGSDSSCCGYGSCQADWKRDPGVAFRRAASIERNFSLTVTVKEPDEYSLFVAGEKLQTWPMPGGVAEIRNAESYARIGSAGPFSTRRWQGDIAEIVVYDRALDDADRRALERYLTCQYFPSGT